MNYFTHMFVQLQQTSLRLMTPSRSCWTPTNQLKFFKANQRCPNLCPLCKSWIWPAYHIMNNIDWLTYKKIWATVWTEQKPAFFRNLCQHCNRWWLHLHLQHSHSKPCGTMCPRQCCCDLTLRSWKLIRPYSQIWVSSCRNSNQSNTKQTKAICTNNTR